MRKCTKCEVEKTTDNYNKCKNRLDGLYAECKQCRNEYKRKARQKGATKILVDNKIVEIITEFPEIFLAERAVRKVSRGRNNEILQHWNYEKKNRQDVVMMSRHNKIKVLVNTIYDQEVMMYRVKHTDELLDTREKFEAFAESLKAQYDIKSVNTLTKH